MGLMKVPYDWKCILPTALLPSRFVVCTFKVSVHLLWLLAWYSASMSWNLYICRFFFRRGLCALNTVHLCPGSCIAVLHIFFSLRGVLRLQYSTPMSRNLYCNFAIFFSLVGGYAIVVQYIYVSESVLNFSYFFLFVGCACAVQFIYVPESVLRCSIFRRGL